MVYVVRRTGPGHGDVEEDLSWLFKSLVFEDSKVKISPQGYLAFGDVSRMHRNNAQLPFERLTSKITKGGPILDL